jgi:hypothetical protein
MRTMIVLILALTLEIAPATLMRTVAEGSDSSIREQLESVIKTPVAQIDTAPYQIIAVPRDRRHVRFIEEVDLTTSANRR